MYTVSLMSILYFKMINDMLISILYIKNYPESRTLITCTYLLQVINLWLLPYWTSLLKTWRVLNFINTSSLTMAIILNTLKREVNLHEYQMGNFTGWVKKTDIFEMQISRTAFLRFDRPYIEIPLVQNISNKCTINWSKA